ncbi:MAG: cupredoxin domain-containing protein [Pseudomonadota bacterium]|nr:cupredoxin domain-containing protein [Pseudomonadota bacterium]
MIRYLLPLLALIVSGAVPVAAVPLAADLLLPEAHAEPPPREIAVQVQGAYKPDRIEVTAGERVRLVFTRTAYTGCTREVVFPELGIRKELPTNGAVAIDLPVLAPGTYQFHWGMNMIHGTLVVTAAKG